MVGSLFSAVLGRMWANFLPDEQVVARDQGMHVKGRSISTHQVVGDAVDVQLA